MKLILSLAILAGACSKGAPAPTARPISDPVPMIEASTPATSSPAARSVLAAYERVRALLAADELKGLPDAAGELAASARTAAADSPASAQLTAIANTSSKLAAASDLEAARAAFGEVSHHVIALLASDKSLAAGQHVFECPMVAGYNKWVQPSTELQNPYMGQRMLTCGGESTWE